MLSVWADQMDNWITHQHLSDAVNDSVLGVREWKIRSEVRQKEWKKLEMHMGCCFRPKFANPAGTLDSIAYML